MTPTLMPRMNFLKSFAAVLLLALMSMQGASAADPTPAPVPIEAGGFFTKMDGAVRAVGQRAGRDLGKAMASSGYSIAATLNQTALGVAGALGLMYLLYEVMQFLSGRTKSMLQVLFDVGIPCIFAAAFITQYAKLLPMFEGLLDVFRNLGTHVDGGASDPFTGILDVYTSIIARVTETVLTAFKNSAKSISVANYFSLSFPFALSLIDLLVTILFALAILVLLLIGVAEVLGLLLIGPFLFAVGVAFGPIMIAGLVTPWTRDYFTKWLQFLVISAALTGVINVIFSIAKQLLDKVTVGMNTGEPTAVSLVILAILVLTINSMISQAPSIASALLPGHIGVSKSSAGAVGTIAKGARNAMKGGKKAAGATGGGAAQGIKQSARFAKKTAGGSAKT
jgi:hypothetical protein